VVAGQILSGLWILTGPDIGFTVPLGMMAIMGVDWGIQYCGLLESTNRRRFVTGMLGGAGYGIIIMQLIVLFLSSHDIFGAIPVWPHTYENSGGT
jgi:uncharacterized membrane protein